MEAIFGLSSYHFEDCSKLHHVISLWGAEGPFKDIELGARFSQFLINNSGKRAVVVLDEVEKMKKDVANSLLSVMQDGSFADTFGHQVVDCSKTTFLLTTNAADDTIKNYWEEHKASILQSSLKTTALQRALRPLDKKIRADVASRMSWSLVSRIDGVLPFFPFTDCKRTIVTHQALLDLQKGLAAPPNEQEGRVHGNITLELQDQPKVCRGIAEDLYREMEGARAINSGVRVQIETPIKCAALEGSMQAVGGVARLVASRDPDDVFDLHLNGE